MSCDLSDSTIIEAYEEIVNGQDTDWLVSFEYMYNYFFSKQLNKY
jgi:hypothetical protein